MGLQGLLRRYRGQTDASSWTAGTLARSGAPLVLALLVLGCLAPGGASAASHSRAPDPSPQKAPPVASSGSRSPDPAPQAVVVTSRPSHPTSPARSVPTVVAPHIVAPTIVHVAAPPPHRTASPNVVARVSKPRPAKAHRAAPVHHARHAAATRVTRVTLSSPLAFLGRDLLRLVPGPFRSSDAPERDGVLLLLASLAMGVLAVSSFALSRRLKGLE